MTDISIGIVTKGRPEILEETLRKISDLGLSKNVIVIDGSGTRETEKVCQKHDCLYYQQTRTGGRCAARNELLEKCETSYLVYIDDDVIISEKWFEELLKTFQNEDVVGVTGKLEGEHVPFSDFTGKIREFLFSHRERFGEIKNNGVINGDFFYDEKKEVDHLVGCNMAFDVEALRSVGGFNEDYDVGNAYREETEPSYLVGQEGKLIYNPDASVNHKEVEEIDGKTESFYVPYLTKYFLSRNNIVSGLRGRASYFMNKIARHSYFSAKSIFGLNHYYLYYLYGELRSFIDYVVLDRKPREYV